MSVPRRRPWLDPTTAMALALGLGLALVAGCDQPTGSTRPRSKAPVVVVDDQPAPAPAPAPPAPQFIVGQKTQDIRDAEKEKKAGGVVTPPKITAKDPIRLTGNAYVSMIGKISIDQIEYALKLYQGETGEYPKTTEEFMEKIIKANNIALPKLPAYQDYVYDAPTHKLQIMEYPDRKKAMGYPE